MEEPSILVVGATGLIGSEVLTMLEPYQDRVGPISLAATEDSAGEVYKFADDELVVEELSDELIESAHVVILAATPEISKEVFSQPKNKNQVLFDLTGEPSLSDQAEKFCYPITARPKREITRFAAPSPMSVILARTLHPIAEIAQMKFLSISTYQAVSDGGQAGLDELWEQTRAIFTQAESDSEVFSYPVAFNSIPQIGAFQSGGSTTVESALGDDLKGFLPSLKTTTIGITCVRVPIFHAHSASLVIELDRDVELSEIEEKLSVHNDLSVFTQDAVPPQALDATGDPRLHIGRIRYCGSSKRHISLWCTADGIRFGIATNLVRTLLENIVDEPVQTEWEV